MATRRPRILLLGNGLNLAYNEGSLSWKGFIRNVSQPDVPDTVTLPLSLEVVLRTKNRVKPTMKAHSRALYGEVNSDEYRAMMRELLNLGFDEILTTNYSYEIETVALGVREISDYRLKKIARSTTGRADRKFLLHSYNEVVTDGVKNHIWHIHGEARKYESMVIDHYQYGALLNRFVNFCRWRDKEKASKVKTGPARESWLDVFMKADVYVLGQGFDFAEMDLWWLVNRKGMESRSGKVIFYEPKSDRNYDAKIELLRSYGAVPVDFGITLPEKPGHRATEETHRKYREETAALYSRFYKMAVEDMKTRIRVKPGV